NGQHSIQHIQQRTPIGWNGRHKSEQIGYADIVNGTPVKAWGESHTSQDRVQTVTTSVNSSPARIGDPFIDQPMYPIRDIVLHFSSPFFKGSFPKCFSISCRTPVIHLENPIAPCGE